MNNDKTGPDVSRADFFFAMLSAQRRHAVEEIAARLKELSSKAEENGARYAQITAENPAATVESKQQNGRSIEHSLAVKNHNLWLIAFAGESRGYRHFLSVRCNLAIPVRDIVACAPYA